MTKKLLLIIALCLLTFRFLPTFVTYKAQAATRPIVISKTMRNVTLSDAAYNGQSVVTVKKTTDNVRVNLVISIPGDKVETDVIIIDVFAELGKTWAITQPFTLYNGSVNVEGNCSGTVVRQLVPTSPAPHERRFQIASATNPLEGRSQYCIQYEGKPQSTTIFPTHKSRLVGHPVFIEESDFSRTLAGISYLYYIPDYSQTSLSSSLYGKKDELLDLGALVPGVSVDVVNTDGSDAKKITTPPVFVLQPNPDSLITTETTASQCGVSLVINPQRSRGGACLFNTQVVMSDNTSGQELGAARAYFMALPSSTIVGNVYSGSGLDANRLLLPGQHSAGSSAGGTSLSKENIRYDIAPNAVNGWDPDQVYRNVYQNANINRLKRSPDLVINSETNCANLAVVIKSCTVIGGTLTVKMQKTVSSTLDLANLDPAKPAPASRKNDFVVYIKGDLTIGISSDNDPDIVTYTTGGTIIVDGKLIIQNVKIVKDATTNPGSLGFVVLKGAGSDPAVTWKNSTTDKDVNLNGVVFFAPSATFEATKTSRGTMKLTGSIVANKVDMSEVRAVAGVDSADSSGITIEYDQSIATSPPPGFQLFSSTPILKDLAP